MSALDKTLARAIDADLDDKDFEAAGRGAMLTDPALASGMITSAYAGPLLSHWKNVSATDVQTAIDLMAHAVKSGDLSDLEAMLVSQAVATQSMFTALAARACGSKDSATVNLLTSLALRAQAQSRSTIDSIANLKFPRTTVIAKQANITSNGGQQQINNGMPHSHAPAHETFVPNELKALETGNGSTPLDAGATRPAGRDRSRDAAMVEINRTTKRGGQVRERA